MFVFMFNGAMFVLNTRRKQAQRIHMAQFPWISGRSSRLQRTFREIGCRVYGGFAGVGGVYGGRGEGRSQSGFLRRRIEELVRNSEDEASKVRFSDGSRQDVGGGAATAEAAAAAIYLTV